MFCRTRNHLLGITPGYVLNFLTKLLLFLKNKFIYLFLAALGLRCCTWVSSSCSERGLLFIAVHRFLIAVASLVAEHGL